MIVLVAAITTMAAASAESAPATLVGPTAAERPVAVSLVLPSRDLQGAQSFVRHVGTPGDPLYRHYLDPHEYANRFGARVEDYDAIVAWAKAQGLTVGEHYAARTVIPLTGSAAVVETALGVRFNDFRDEKGRLFYAAGGPVRLPPSLAGKVAGVVGLSDATHFAPHLVVLPVGVHPSVSGTGADGAYSAADLRKIYTVPSLSFAEQPQTLAVFEQGGFAPQDVSTYVRRNGLPDVPATLRSVNGYGGGIDDASVELEAVLDIDMLIAMDPAAKQILVYEDGTDPFPVALLDSLSAMASDNQASTISISYGQDEALEGSDAIAAENSVLTQMAAQGQAVFVSSGDQGAFGNRTNRLNVSDPASQPLVTSVGGLTVFTAPNKSIVQEVWNDLATGFGAGGGGISTVWPIPHYQRVGGRSVAKPAGGSASFRNVPDVSLVANPLTGVAVYSAGNGGWRTVGGTSASAPLWAGFYSLSTGVSEAFGFPEPGFANPALYVMGQGNAVLGASITDVVDGTNGAFERSRLVGFSASFGFDDASGYGSFNGELALPNLVLAAAVAGKKPPPAPANIAAAITATKVTVTWADVPSATGYFVAVQNQFTGEQKAALVKTGTATFVGLSPATPYEYFVAAVSPGGLGLSPPAGFSTLSKK